MLRAILPGLLACALGASTAQADNILYATAATTGEITSYCVGDNGGLNPEPRQRIDTRGRAPSRLVTAKLSGGTFLYVAENDRVEVFRIGDDGRLTRRGSIPDQPLQGMNSHDLTIVTAPNGTPMLYVPQRRQDRIAAFPLDPATGLTTSTEQAGSSCVLGSIPSDWEDVVVANGLLYASGSVSRGQVVVYQLTADGNFANGTVVVDERIGSAVNATQCATRTVAGVEINPCDQNEKAYAVDSAKCTEGVVITDIDGNPITREPTRKDPNPSPLTVRGQIEPYAGRRRLNGASSVILNGDLLYVSERFRRAISVLQVCPAEGQPPQCPGVIGKQGDDCTCPDANEDGLPDVPDLCPPFGLSVDAKVNDEGVCTVRNRQRRGTSANTGPTTRRRGRRTRNDIRYNALVLAQGSEGASILGAQFLDGRIDGYRLQDADEDIPPGGIPRESTIRTNDNFQASPFQMFVFPPYPSVGQVLFVGGGEIDRVQAFRLNARGLPRESQPFAQTVRLRDTFPNAVTVIDIAGSCPVR